MSSHHTYTVRGVPEAVDRKLRERAKQKQTSINQVILEALSEATGHSKKYASFCDLVGSWKPDTEFEAMMEWQRRVDLEDWE